MEPKDQIIAVIGHTNIGKTALSKWLTTPKGKFSFTKLNLQSTILVEHKGEGFHIYDTGGKPALDLLRVTVYKKDINCILLCFSLEDRESFDLIKSKFLPEFRLNFGSGRDEKKKPPVFLVGLKDDLVENMEDVIPQKDIFSVVNDQGFLSYLNVSTKSCVNCQALKDLLRSFEGSKSPIKQLKENRSSGRLDLKKKASGRLGGVGKPVLKKKTSVAAFFGFGKDKTIGGNPFFDMEESVYPIHQLIYDGEREEVLKLIKMGIDLNVKTKHLNTPLHYAAYCNRIEIVKDLLKCPEIETNGYNAQGETPLTIGSKYGFCFIVQHLIDKGKGDMEKRNKMGAAPIDLSKNSDTQNTFFAQMTREEKFIEAIKEKDLVSIKNYIDFVSPNCHTLAGDSALKIALEQVGMDDLIADLVNRRAEIKKEWYEKNIFYKNDMIEFHRKKRRDDIVLDILATEKTYNDDLMLLLNTFVKPLVPKMAKITKDKEYRSMISNMMSFISMIHHQTEVFVKGMMEHCPGFELANHLEIAKLFEELQFDSYLKFQKVYMPLSVLVTQKKELEKFQSYLTKQESEIPKYRSVKSFWGLLKAPHIRLIKYRSYFERLLSECGRNEIELRDVFERTLSKLKVKANAVDRMTNELKRKNMMLEVSELMDKLYDFKVLLKDKNRGYVYHEIGVEKLYSRSFCGESNVKKIDLFIFTDVLFIGSGKERRKLLFYFYKKNKIKFEIGFDSLRITVFSGKKSNIEEDFMVYVKIPRKWIKPIEEVFSHDLENYSRNILVINHELNDVPEVQRFLSKPMIRREKVDEIQVREEEIERLNGLVGRNRNWNRELDEEVESLKKEIEEIKEKRIKEEEEKQERKKKMMELVAIKKKELQERLERERIERERDREERERLKEEREKQKLMKDNLPKLNTDSKRKKRKSIFGFRRSKTSKTPSTEQEKNPLENLKGSMTTVSPSSSSSFNEPKFIHRGGITDERGERSGGGIDSLLGLNNMIGDDDSDDGKGKGGWDRKDDLPKKGTVKNMMNSFSSPKRSNFDKLLSKDYDFSMDDFDIDKALSGSHSSVKRGRARFGGDLGNGLRNEDMDDLSATAEKEEQRMKEILEKMKSLEEEF